MSSTIQLSPRATDATAPPDPTPSRDPEPAPPTSPEPAPWHDPGPPVRTVNLPPDTPSPGIPVDNPERTARLVG
jgi:hypothetical protein